MKTIRCLVVDDEVLARRGFVRQLKKYTQFEVVGEAGSQETFFKEMERLQPDVVFLDIMLRHKNSMDYLTRDSVLPILVFVSAYSHYALKGFDLKAEDYLLKPVSDERLDQCIQKITAVFSSRNVSSRDANNYVYLKSNGRFHRIPPNDILYIKSLENYVVVHLESKKLICKITLGQITKLLPRNHFVQVHRSYVVNLNRIDCVEKLNVYIRDEIIPISRDKKLETYKELMGTMYPWDTAD